MTSKRKMPPWKVSLSAKKWLRDDENYYRDVASLVDVPVVDLNYVAKVSDDEG